MQLPDSTAVRPAVPEAEPCNYCEQSIIWTKTEKGARMPVDAAPTVAGNVLVRVTGGDVLAAVIGSKGKRDAMRAHGVQLRTHHRMSCPRASEWAGGRRA